jgi:hypothetical protein
VNLSYAWRLAAFALASFFVIWLALSVAMRIAVPAVLRAVERLRPAVAANLLFALCIAPVAGAALLSVGFAIPSYLQFEPSAAQENVGEVCLACAGLGVVLLGSGMVRACAAWLQTRRFVKNSEALVYSTGLFRSRICVPREVKNVLTLAQLELVVRHEQAHEQAYDNLKKLLLVLSPSVRLGSVERAQAKFSEWAADDCATGGDEENSLLLAEALVRVARLGAPVRSALLVAPLISQSEELAERVDRLLSSPQRPQPRPMPIIPISAISFVIAVQVLRSHDLLRAVHGLLEKWID